MPSEKDVLEAITGEAQEVEKLLRLEERCTFASPTLLIKKGKKKPRKVAIIINRANMTESCVFMLEHKRGITRIVEVRPVLTHFSVQTFTEQEASLLNEKCELEPNLLVCLKFGKVRILLEMPSYELLAKLVAELKQMHATAVAENFTPKRTSHLWSLFYSQPPAELLNLVDNENTDLLSKKSTLERDESTHANSDNPFISANTTEGSAYVRASYSSIKQAWIRKEITHREKEFTDFTQLIVFTGTWNVNGKHPAEDVSAWLHPNDGSEPDIYVLGFQELDLSAQAFLLDNSAREDGWTRSIENSLKKKGQYKKLISKQLVGMLILVYIKQKLLPHVSEMSSDAVGTGVLGMMGNKGGVGVRFKVYDSYFCFLNSHLAAGSDELERRNSDFKDVSKKMVFTTALPNEPITYSSIFDSDFLVWMGDFNYRIAMADSEVRNYIEKKDYSFPLKYDQLHMQRRARKAFGGFDEGAINFHPSYKYDPGTDNFDTSEKKRAPAWCDRILWRSGDKLEQLVYKCHMDLKTSDHKPVSSIFVASKVKIYSKERMNEVQMDIVRELDKFENECMPDATLSENILDFGLVKYLVPITKGFVLENTGQVLMQFHFIPKLEESNICKPWIWVSPTTGMLLPGDKVLLSVTVLVDNRTAPKLNTDPKEFEDILVLHLVNGKDFFVSICGTYLPTCFSTPLDSLVRLSAPVRPSGEGEAKTAITSPLSIPKELWRMVDYIYRNGLDTEGLFVTAGEFDEMEMIRDCLDEGSEFKFSPESHSGVFSVCETLLRFLDALPEPVIPFGVYQKCLDAHQSYQLAKQALALLPAVNYNVFVYLSAFLREVLAHQQQNGMTLESLAVIFSTVLLRSPKTVSERYRDVVDKKKTAFLTHFLYNANEIP